MLLKCCFFLFTIETLMAKKKGLSYEQKMIKALSELPNPIIDNKHRIKIIVEDNKARSNETRFEHISLQRHDLKPADIKRIPEKIKSSDFKKDAERKDTYNIYIKRNNVGKEYIKISLEIDFKKSNEAFVKTIFITNVKK